MNLYFDIKNYLLKNYDIKQAKKVLKECPLSEPISDDVKKLIKKYLED